MYQIADAKIKGAICFVANCFGLGSKMVEALYQSGAAAVIAGPGKNYISRLARLGIIAGADRLGARLLAHLRAGLATDRALFAARDDVRVWARFSPADRDALEFQIDRSPTL